MNANLRVDIMIKQIVFLLSLLGCAFSLTANVENDSIKRETTSVTASSGVVKKRVLSIQDDYDIETYDIYGNLRQYLNATVVGNSNAGYYVGDAFDYSLY